MTAFENTPNPSKLRMWLAMITPKEVMANDNRNIRPRPWRTSVHARLTSAKRASASTNDPCTIATVAPPKTLPKRIKARGIGETRISRRKPNSRSQITETADWTDV